ncbi:MAG: hypothetical protein IKK93_11995 [Campylobacter sp.]|nr:hypothetical protein [Campylobacter sp.]
MKKLEIFEKLKDFKDTDEIIFLKKEAHWVPAPEDSWDGDVVYSTTMVQVDDMIVDVRRSSKYRVVYFYNIDDNFKVLCLSPHSKFVETDFLNEDGEKIIHYPMTTLNYKSISSKDSFNTRDELIAYVNNFVGKSSGHKYNESEIIWGTGRD